MQTLSQRTLAIIALGLILLLYSVVSRLIGIYFFWESGFIGATITAVGAASLFYDRIIWKESAGKSNVPEKVAMGLVLFMILMQFIILLVFSRSDAYAAAKNHLMADTALNEALGGIEAITVVPFGGMEKGTDENGQFGHAELSLILKGKTKYKSVTVNLVLEPQYPVWKVVEVE